VQAGPEPQLSGRAGTFTSLNRIRVILNLRSIPQHIYDGFLVDGRGGYVAGDSEACCIVGLKDKQRC